MSLRAIILWEPAAAGLKIAGLTLLDRLVVAAHRAGCAPVILVGAGPLPRLNRTSALGIPVQTVSEIPARDQPALVLRAQSLVLAADLRRVCEQRGRLTTRAGEALPIGIVAEWPDRLDAALAEAPAVTAEGVAVPVVDAASARAAARVLWASLGSPADGLVDRYFNRPVGRPLSKLLVQTAVTPNQVSVAATVLGLLSAVCFATGSPRRALLGAVLLQLSAIIDCIDGDLARVAFKESRLGKWLDLVGDQVVHIGVFLALAIGLRRAGVEAPLLWLGASAVVGVVLSFLVVLRGMLQPERLQNSRLQKLIDATTNRDFSVLLLALAALGRLEIFLWIAAVGVHVFWITAWWLQWRGAPDARLQPQREKHP